MADDEVGLPKSTKRKEGDSGEKAERKESESPLSLLADVESLNLFDLDPRKKKTKNFQIATIAKLARDAAAPVLAGTNARLSGDAIDATLSCADEFVRLVYAEGKEKSFFKSFIFFSFQNFVFFSFPSHHTSSFHFFLLPSSKQPSRPPTPPRRPRSSPTTSSPPSRTWASTTRSSR